ncbi:MAG TPA: hypothetical protein VFW90_02475 [Candidatus Saccharimonadales bacterium]|nr:hypothetical protein [Candidatus Saccharimonadales bacterium]
MSKGMLWISITVFSFIGSYIPALWHAGFLSAASIIGGFLGAIFGIWAAYKLSDFIGV